MMTAASWPWIDFEKTNIPLLELQETVTPPSPTPEFSIGSSVSAGSSDVDVLSRQLAGKLLLEQRQLQLQQQTLPLPPSNPRFKTEICRNFKEKGACVYGGLCQFAHGKHELRQDVVRHTKYKTKLCQKYWIAGYCAYGPRCNFIHKEMEKRSAEELCSLLPPSSSTALPGVVSTQNPPSIIRRAGTGFTRPTSATPSTLVRNVSDVLRIAKMRGGGSGSRGTSQGDSGNESGSDYGNSGNVGSEAGEFSIYRPIGSERVGRTIW